MTGQDTVQEWITGAGNTRDQKSKAARLTGSGKSAAPQESGGVCRETAGIIHKTGNGQSREHSENRHSGTEKHTAEGSCKLLAPMTVQSAPQGV